MSAYDWQRLSEFHNAWLEGNAGERHELRTRLAAEQPGLLEEADALLASSGALPGFLATPALVVAAHEIAREAVPLSPGDQVGPYQVVGILAHGGMGDVYRATDVRLHRDVALKVLAQAAAPDSDAIDRFVQEARITAALDHPNIVRVFDVGMFRGRPYIVAELLAGETLRGRLAAGPASVGDARRIAADIARGLVAAHEAGLVHRDLKPENVFLSASGTTKILDFGIAKLLRPRAPGEESATRDGVLLGTTGYLAPEQIEGAAVDGRADLFALGAILFETLTGRRAFGRGHSVDALHDVVHGPAPNVAEHREGVPATLAAVTDRLLQKRPEARFQSAADLAWALEHLDNPLSSLNTPRAAPAVLGRKPFPGSTGWPLAAMALASAAVVAVVALVGRDRSPEPGRPLMQSTWSLPPELTLDSAGVIAPDQQRIAFVGRDASAARLFVRDLASLVPVAIPGTEGAKQPFWSPDGQFIGFFANGKLMKVPARGGPPIVLADAPDARGGTWSSQNVIVFQPDMRDSGLFRVSAGGSAVEPATHLDADAGEIGQRYPAFLPDGLHFLYHAGWTNDDQRGVYLARLDAPTSERAALLFRSDAPATYAAGPGRIGFVLSAVSGRIEARAFDDKRLALIGEPRTLPFTAATATLRHESFLSASPDVLAFTGVPVTSAVHTASVSRDGRDLRISPNAEMTGWLRLSPDGTRLMRTIVDPARGNPDIWVEDLARGTRLRITTSSNLDVSAVWSADGQQVAFRSSRGSTTNISIASADGGGTQHTRPCPGVVCEPTDWSSDGHTLLVNSDGDVWIFPTSPAGTPQPLLAGTFVERDARLSADGQWLLYVSEESGRPEVLLRSMTGAPRRQVVSAGGGDQPVWRRDGRELLYVDVQGQLHSVSVRRGTGGQLILGAPTTLAVPRLAEHHWGTTYDISRDGERVYFPHPGNHPRPHELGIVLNWKELLRSPN